MFPYWNASAVTLAEGSGDGYLARCYKDGISGALKVPPVFALSLTSGTFTEKINKSKNPFPSIHPPPNLEAQLCARGEAPHGVLIFARGCVNRSDSICEYVLNRA